MHQFELALAQAFEKLNLPKNDQAWAKLLDYLDLLQKWNQTYNLTAIRDPHEMLVKHVFDSLAVAPLIDSERLIDVGTGGGLPGIPLAILYPDRQVDLLDSNSKKTRFLVQAKASLGLKNTRVIHSRVEAYHPDENYDGVVSRAFASMEDMIYWTQHLLKPKGVWWAMKSQAVESELVNLPECIQLDAQYLLKVPELDAQRILIKLRQSESF